MGDMEVCILKRGFITTRIFQLWQTKLPARFPTITVTDQPSSKVQLLVVDESCSEEALAALLRGKEVNGVVVSHRWPIECLKQGIVLPLEQFVLKLNINMGRSTAAPAAPAVQAVQAVQAAAGPRKPESALSGMSVSVSSKPSTPPLPLVTQPYETKVTEVAGTARSETAASNPPITSSETSTISASTLPITVCKSPGPPGNPNSRITDRLDEFAFFYELERVSSSSSLSVCMSVCMYACITI
jgi:hypothetical protein